MEELFKLISDKYAHAISSRLAIDKLAELRIRNGAPVSVWYNGLYRFLCENGITKDPAEAFIAEKSEAESVVLRACNRSLYTVTETLKRGYISIGGGIRIGVCGSAVTSGDTVTAVKDFTSVNIRLPHEIKGCASVVFSKTVGNGIKNTLIISPPGAGKTTVLRDLCRQISDRGFNVLLCDERYEIAACSRGVPTLDVGRCTDVISGADKRSAFTAGIAFMRPDVIIADELFDVDLGGLLRAVHCGVSVICTAHARDYADIKQKAGYAAIIGSHIFERFVVISDPPRRDITVLDADGLSVSYGGAA